MGCSATIGNARRGSCGLGQGPRQSLMTLLLKAPSTALRRIWPAMSTSIALSALHNEGERRCSSGQPDQHGVGTSEQLECGPYIFGCRSATTASHDGVIDLDPSVDPRPGQGEIEGAGHRGFRITCVRRAMMRRV